MFVQLSPLPEAAAEEAPSADRTTYASAQWMLQNPFTIMGLGGASREEVIMMTVDDWRRAYYAQCRLYHPDKGAIDAEQFHILKDTYDALSHMTTSGLLVVAEHWLRSQSGSSAITQRRRPPGVIMLQNALRESFTQRAASSMTRVQARELVASSQRNLCLLKAQPYVIPLLDRADRAAKDVAKEDLLQQEATRHVEAKASRQLRTIAARKRRCEEQGVPYTGVTPGRIRHAKRGWKRAFLHRFRRTYKEKEKEKESKDDPEDNEAAVRESWRKYRREGQEWQPPAEPQYKRSKPSAAAMKRKRLKLRIRRRFLKGKRCAIEDVTAPGGGAELSHPAASSSGTRIAARRARTEEFWSLVPKCMPRPLPQEKKKPTKRGGRRARNRASGSQEIPAPDILEGADERPAAPQMEITAAEENIGESTATRVNLRLRISLTRPTADTQPRPLRVVIGQPPAVAPAHPPRASAPRPEPKAPSRPTGFPAPKPMPDRSQRAVPIRPTRPLPKRPPSLFAAAGKRASRPLTVARPTVPMPKRPEVSQPASGSADPP